jgi:hypothetical protein
MPHAKCAYQMVIAYEAVVNKSVKEFTEPTSLIYATMKHEKLLKY